MARRRQDTQEVKNGNNRNKKAWNTAIYIRLSRDEIGKNESDSVVNQRAILKEFLQNHSDEFSVIGEYVDDGHTGTDSERESFLRLLRDIEARKVNCVLVKDLSRFARNYYEAGYYIENLFTRFDVRFICLHNPCLDSYLHPEQMNSIAVPIQNVMNDDFCRQTSLKVRSVFDYKRRQGQFIGAFAAYGYRKSQQDKHRLEIDVDAALTVQKIYQWYLEGISKQGIARKLNGLGIPNPSSYKRLHGLAYHSSVKNPSPLWSEKTVAQILRDELYIGNMVQGKQRVRSYKIHTQIRLPKAEWFIVENTHEAIIDQDTFQKAQNLQKRDICVPSGQGKAYLFSGFLRCGDCGRAMHRKSAKGIVYYECRTYKESGRKECGRHSIRHSQMEEGILALLQKEIEMIIEFPALLENLQRIMPASSKTEYWNARAQETQESLQKIASYQKGLYESLRDGDLSREEYHRLKAEYASQEEAQKGRLQNILQEQNKLKTVQETSVYQDFITCHNLSCLNRELLLELVDYIWVYRDKRIKIRFKCCDETTSLQ